MSNTYLGRYLGSQDNQPPGQGVGSREMGNRRWWMVDGAWRDGMAALNLPSCLPFKSLRRRPLGRRLVWWQWEDPGMLSGNKTERAFSL